MGSLKPGATYIYEHADGITYAREFGAPAVERFEIGRTYERQEKDTKLESTFLWSEITLAARSNPALQEAIDRVKIIYHLSKNDGKE